MAAARQELRRLNQEVLNNKAEATSTRSGYLGKALDRLQQFYADKALIQKKSHTLHLKKQAPPVQVTEYKKSGGAAGVTVMLENLITETKQLEAEATEGEKEAQASYEEFIDRKHTSELQSP